MEGEYTAKLFMSGGSQAVRLPRNCRFPGSEVRVRKQGCAVILEPLEKSDWPPGYWDWFRSLPPVADDFDVPEPLPPVPHRLEWSDGASCEPPSGGA